MKKLFLFVEFWKSSKDSGFDIDHRDNLFDAGYKQIYASSSRGRAGRGAMFWQLMVEGMRSYGDGYEIVLSQSPFTTSNTNMMHVHSRGYTKTFFVQISPHENDMGETLCSLNFSNRVQD